MTKRPPEPSASFDGEEELRARLSEASGSYEPLPGAVADRLERALADLPELSAPDTTPVASPPVKVPWWRRRLVVAAAAAVFVFGGAGVAAQQLMVPDQTSTAADSESDSGADIPQSSRENAPQDSEPGINEAPESETATLTFSGRNYVDGELGEAADAQGVNEKSSLDSSLDGLAQDQAQREACLSAVAEQVGGTVSAVDFGSFKQQPAMIVVLSSDEQPVAAVAVGGQCGSEDTDIHKSERL